MTWQISCIHYCRAKRSFLTRCSKLCAGRHRAYLDTCQSASLRARQYFSLHTSHFRSFESEPVTKCTDTPKQSFVFCSFQTAGMPQYTFAPYRFCGSCKVEWRRHDILCQLRPDNQSLECESRYCCSNTGGPGTSCEHISAVSDYVIRTGPFGFRHRTISSHELELEAAPVKRLTGHQQAVNHIAFSPDGRFFASASFDKKVKIWSGLSVASLICQSTRVASNEKALL